jgi:hypothetical protein
MNITYSLHAEEEIIARSIPKEIIEQIVQDPQQTMPDEQDETVEIYQSIIEFSNGLSYLVRIFVTQRESALHVVTVYRTSKISKYWRQE